MQEKIEKKFSAFEIIASQLVALNFSIKKRLLVIVTHCVSKHSEDFEYD